MSLILPPAVAEERRRQAVQVEAEKTKELLHYSEEDNEKAKVLAAELASRSEPITPQVWKALLTQPPFRDATNEWIKGFLNLQVVPQIIATDRQLVFQTFGQHFSAVKSNLDQQGHDSSGLNELMTTIAEVLRGAPLFNFEVSLKGIYDPPTAPEPTSESESTSSEPLLAQ